jgi:chorismate mutase
MTRKPADLRPVRLATRGIRGAVPVLSNTKSAIFSATRRLLVRMIRANGIRVADIAGVILTSTPDLNAEFPAYAARSLDWKYVPLLCASEIDVPGAMERLIRALMLVNTELAQEEIRHQYLGAAKNLRPDLVNGFVLRSPPLRRAHRSSKRRS